MVRALFFFRFGKRQAITLTLHKLRMSPHPFSLCPRVAPALLHRSGERGKRAAPGGEPETQTLSFVAASAVSGVPCSMFHVRCWMFDALIRPHPSPLPRERGGRVRRQETVRERGHTPPRQPVRFTTFNVPCSMFHVRCWMFNVGCWMLRSLAVFLCNYGENSKQRAMIVNSRRCRVGLLSVCAFLPLAAAEPKGPAPAESLPELQRRIAEHLAQPRFEAALWGVKIVSLDSGATVFESNPSKRLKPSSNAKLFTAALALDRLGPAFRIKTSVYSHTGPDPSGVVRGDLTVFGRGDCTAPALLAAGVRRVEGDLVGDESYFRGPPLGSSWAWDDLQNYYGAEVSALTQEDNVVDLVFESGAAAGDPCVIITKPPTDCLTFVNRAKTAGRGARREITLWR